MCAFTGWGTTSARAKVALGWRGALWAKLSLLTSATSCFDPKGQTWVFFHKPTMKLLPHPPASTHLYKHGKGKLYDVVKLMANCLEQKGTMRAMSRGEYDGLVAANEPTGFEELRRYDDVRVPEPSHQARHDLLRLEHRQAPAEH